MVSEKVNAELEKVKEHYNVPVLDNRKWDLWEWVSHFSQDLSLHKGCNIGEWWSHVGEIKKTKITLYRYHV